MQWTKNTYGPGVRADYTAADGTVTIDYCANAGTTRWRARDDRGVSPETPKPLDACMSFHRTLREAKTWAETNTWHVDGVVPAPKSWV